MDKFILILIGISAIVGLWRGFFREVVSTLGLLLALIAANIVSPYARPYLDWVRSETISSILVWVISFLLTMALLTWLARLMDKLMESISLSGLNRLCGGIVGALKGIILIALLISAAQVFCGYIPSPWLEARLSESQLVPWVHQIMDIITPWASQHILQPALELLKH